MTIKITKLLKNRTAQILIFLFVAAVAIRFIYFPGNIYFGFDQARDAFISQEILKGEFKIVGPSTTTLEGLYHGALFYYIFAPIYFFSQGDPTLLSIFLRIYTAAGLFVVFLIGNYLFNKKVGLIAALLFAVSYEQTQYSLFLSHVPLAIITVLLFYLGMVLLIFKNNSKGLILTLVSLGLSVQFQVALTYLAGILVVNMIVFFKSFYKAGIKSWALAILGFLIAISTFIIAEIKLHLNTIGALLHRAESLGPTGDSSGSLLPYVLSIANRYVFDNLIAVSALTPFVLLGLAALSIFFIFRTKFSKQVIFLLIWFSGALLPYLLNNTSLYYYGVSGSVSLLVLVSFGLYLLYKKNRYIAALIAIVIISSNFYLVLTRNQNGPNAEINVQTGMLLENEKAAIDYIYQKADGQPFAVNALSMPLFINTTWAYLFENYGQKKYGYLPVWGGKAADGYLGNLTINNARTTLPDKRFLIIESVRGIENQVDGFMTEEGYFTDIIEEKKFGVISVNFQKPK